MQAIYSGTIQTGIDRTGLFGGPINQILDGLNFQLTYFFEPALGSFNYGGPGFDSPIFNYSYGGRYVQMGIEYDYGTNPSLGVLFSIEGLPSAVSFFGSYSFMFGHNAGGMSGQSHGVISDTGDAISAQVQANHEGIPASFVGPFSYNLIGDDYFYGIFQLGSGSGYSPSFGYLTITNLSVDVVTSLPAALPLFATGLGALGLVAHRRRRKPAA